MRRKILYVDDDLTNLELFRLHFEREFEIIICDDPTEAANMADEMEVPLIVTDYKMPEMTGMEVVREIKSRTPDRVCILLSAYLDELIEINGELLFEFVSKPYDIQEMIKVLKKAIDHYDAQQSSTEASQ